jgi:hypothetical protein
MTSQAWRWISWICLVLGGYRKLYSYWALTTIHGPRGHHMYGNWRTLYSAAQVVESS